MKHFRKNAVGRYTLFAVLSALAGGAAAHRPWMLPSTSQVDAVGGYVSVDAAISEQLFNFDHRPLAVDGIVVTGPDGALLAPENIVGGKLRTTFELKLDKPGTYRLTLASDNAMASYTANGEQKRWRGNPAELDRNVPAGAQDLKVTRTHSRLETFVAAGDPGKLAFKPAGDGIEFEPLTNPADLRAGETARWRFHVNGKPASRLEFSLVPGGVRYRGTIGELRFATDDSGVANIKLPAAGMYWLSTSLPAKAVLEANPAARRMSYSATLEVLPP